MEIPNDLKELILKARFEKGATILQLIDTFGAESVFAAFQCDGIAACVAIKSQRDLPNLEDA